MGLQVNVLSEPKGGKVCGIRPESARSTNEAVFRLNP